MLVRNYTLPTYKQGVYAIEKTRNELMDRYRSGQRLELEEQDWLDWAERFLVTKTR